MAIDPLQLAVRYHPPQLALVYSYAGDTLVHKIPLSPVDLDEEATSVVGRLRLQHKGYLEEIRTEQLIRLVEMVQLHQEQLNRGALFSKPDRFSASDEESGHIDFKAIERDLDYYDDEF